MRLSEARLQAESSRYMYSEQGLEELMRAVLDRRVPLVDGGVVLHARVAADPGGFGDHAQHVLGLVGIHGLAVFAGLGGPGAVVEGGVHELVRHAHRVVGVLELDGIIGSAGHVETALVAGLDEGPGFLFFVALGLDEIHDVRMVGVQDDHLGRAARAPARLDDAREANRNPSGRRRARRPCRRRKVSRARNAGRKSWCRFPSRT